MKKILLMLSILITVSPTVFAEEIEVEIPLGIQLDKPIDIQHDIKLGAPIDFPDDLEEKVPEKTPLTVSEINAMSDDEQKVKEWAKFNSTENYLIINKKDCSAIVYDKNGNEIKEFEIGVGREKGDDFNDTSGLVGKAKNTTPAGEFILIQNIFNKDAYGDLTLSLGSKANKSKKSKKMVALHKVPKFRQERLCKFNDGNLANNRMSHGCINFLEKDFKELTKYIRSGFKVYVLPEEKDNKLMLVKNDKNGFEFVQTKY